MIFQSSVQAGPYFWDPQGLAKPSDGSGNWDDTTVSNWWNGTSLIVYTNNLPLNPNGGNSTNVIIGAGVAGTYYITNINAVEASTLIFSNTGTTYTSYTISGNQLGVMQPTSVNGPVLISQSFTSNTITANSSTTPVGVFMNQGNDVSNAPNSVLTLATGLDAFGGNPRFEGINNANSTVNLTGGTVSDTSQGTMQVSGITMNITNAIFNAPARMDISRNAVQSSAAAFATINVYNGGQLNANTKAGSNSGNHMQLTRTGGGTILNVYTGGLVSTVGGGFSANNVSTAGNIRILPDSGGQASLNVLGGTVLVGDGANVLGSAGSWDQYLTSVTFFDSNPGLNANSLAVLNMQSGSLTAYAITFGTPGGTSTGPTNGININGGTLYLGAGNISHPSSTGTNFFFNLSGGTVSAIQNWSTPCSVPINLTNVNGNITFQTTDIGGSTPYNMAFSGPLTGVGGFNLIGGGTLTLSGANNYSGSSVISNGVLVVNTASSPVGGPLALNGTPTNSIAVGSGHSWTIGNLNYNTGTPTADFSYGNFNPSRKVPAIQVNGSLSFTVTPLATVEGSAIPDGIYPLINYTGAISGTAPSAVVINGSATTGYISNNITAQSIELVVTNSSVPSPLVWAVGSGSWDTSSLNWNKNGLSVAYADPGAVQFDDTASGPFPITVTVTTAVNPGSITVAATNSYAIAGPGAIGGTGKLVKSSSGILTLSGTNTYSGGTAISGGTVNINFGGNSVNNSAVGTGLLAIGGANIDNTSGQAITLLPQVPEQWNGGWSFLGTTNLNLGTGSITLSNGLVALNVVSNSLEIDGLISDNGAGDEIQKDGAGTLILSNANTFSGGMQVAAGTLVINNASAVGTGKLTLEAAIDNQSGAPIVVSGPSLIDMYSFTFLGTTNLDLGSGPAKVESTIVMNLSNATLTLEGDLNGSSSGVTKNGPGNLVIAGSGASGSVGFTVNAGTLYADRSGVATFGVGQPLVVNTNGTLLVLNPNGGSPEQFNLNSLTLNGGLVELNGESGDTLQGITFNSGVLSDSSPASAVINLAAGFVVTLGGVADFAVTNGATLAINGTFAGTTTNGALLKTGQGELILETNTTYIGNTVVSNGVLSLTWPTLSSASTVTIASGATLDLNFTNTVSTTNIVAALIVNGVSKPAGIYNSNNAAYITSGGSLQVVPPLMVNPIPGTIQFSLSGNTLNLAWPTNAGWTLQSNTNLLSANWVTVPGSALVTNLNITATNPAMFYRMFLTP